MPGGKNRVGGENVHLPAPATAYLLSSKQTPSFTLQLRHDGDGRPQASSTADLLDRPLLLTCFHGVALDGCFSI